MRTVKLILGILSLVLFIIIMLQSCAVGVVNSIDENSSDISGGAGTLLAFVMLIAGIIGVVARDSKKGSMVAGIFYVVGALIGFIGHGTYGDLVVWSVVALAFGIVFIVFALRMGRSRIEARQGARGYEPRRDYAQRSDRQRASQRQERRPPERYGTMQRSQRR